MAEQSEKTSNTNIIPISSSEIVKKSKLSWDGKSHEEGVDNLAKYLFGINEKETEDGFPDIEFFDNFKDEEIKVFMKVIKKLVERGEFLKNQNQNLNKDGVIVQSEERHKALNSGLTHLNKYMYPVFYKRYNDWIARKKTDERINRMIKENEELKVKLGNKKRKTNDKNDNSSDQSDTKSSDSDSNNDTSHKSKKKCTKNNSKS